MIIVEKITSKNNPKVKQWLSLLGKKGRQETGLYIIEGVKIIEEALLSKQKITSIIYADQQGLSQEIAQHLSPGLAIPQYAVSSEIIAKLTNTITPQGIIAIVQAAKEREDQFFLKKNYLLLLDEIQDPGNLGTIIRSAVGAGVEGIVLGKGTVELYNPKVIRSAMGTLFHMPIISSDLDKLIPLLKADGIKVIGTSPQTDKDYYDLDLTGRIAILVGNESNGLSADRKLQVDEMVKIPLAPNAESLNVAMAATIILHDRVRQLAKQN